MPFTSKTPHVVIACDKFKGSLNVQEVAHHIASSVTDTFPHATTDAVFVADGGDGTLEAATAMGFDRVGISVEGPTGETQQTAYAFRDDVAVVEMADACGLVHLPGGTLHPMTASSYGLGEVLATALDQSSIKHIVLGVGGSASTDGGAGMLQALGARLVDHDGREIGRGGGPLTHIADVDFAGLHPRLADVRITLASDVNNPLLGKNGAAAIFGPQKGATPADVEALDAALTQFVRVMSRHFPDAPELAQRPGAGAAGGVGFAALTALHAAMSPGIELMLDLANFDQRVKDADLVITGEGALDSQSLAGKTPVGVAHSAHAAGVPVVAVCGKLTLTTDELNAAHIRAAYALNTVEPDVAECMKNAGLLLEVVVGRALRDWVSKN